jgi:hypothetical protein
MILWLYYSYKYIVLHSISYTVQNYTYGALMWILSDGWTPILMMGSELY